MAVTVTLEVPGGTEDVYRATNDRIQQAPWWPPEGFLAHSAAPDGSGGMRIVDFWESAAAFEAFIEKATPIFQETGLPPVMPRIDEAWNVVIKQ
jgi:hypothetical protein